MSASPTKKKELSPSKVPKVINVESHNFSPELQTDTPKKENINIRGNCFTA